MCDDDDYLALVRDLPEPPHQVSRDDAVQAGVRLVENEEIWVGDVFHGYGKAFPLAARQFLDQTVLNAGESELLEDRVHAIVHNFICGISREPQDSCVLKREVDGVIVADQVLLGNKPDRVFHLVVFVVDVHAVQKNLGVRFFVACHCVDKSGLARAGTAEQQDHMAGLDIHENVAQQIASVEKITYGAVLDLHGQAVVRGLRALKERLVELGGEQRVIAVVSRERALGTEVAAEAPDQSRKALEKDPEPRPVLGDLEIPAQVDADPRLIDQGREQ